MPAVSSVDAAAGVGATSVRGLGLSRRTRLSMVAAGLIPLTHVVTALAPLGAAATGRLSWLAAAAGGAVVLYVLPPLMVRALWHGRQPPARSEVGGGVFLRWWVSAQLQVVFARLPFLEEVVRLVPGLYSAWLRLWGARTGSFVYWSPGVRILDRQWLDVGSRVVFGVGVRLNAHVLARHGQRETELFLGRITVGDDALIGGYSLLLPGCVVGAGEVTPPLRSIHAFSRWEGGRHATRTDQGLADAAAP